MQSRTINYLFLLSILLCFTSAENCWKDAYGRGAGRPIHQCADGLEQSGLLCYPPCKAGYYGVGPVCWQSCPSDFTDTGVDCLKPPSYGRGAGYPLWQRDKCESENPQGCEKWGLIWYPKCKANFHNVACCVCSPDCPSGFVDIGVSCQKDSYGRGAGVPLGCGHDEVESGALCYPPCKNGYDGNGPVCWAQCPAGKADCSALCTDSSEGCSGSVKSIVEDVVAAAVVIAEAAAGDVNITDIISKIGKIAIDLASGICAKPTAVDLLLRLE